MSDLRPVGVPIDLGGVERHFLFTLNAIDAIESHYNCSMFEALQRLADRKTQRETLRFFVATLVNDEAEREKWKNPDSDWRTVTEKEAGWLVTAENIGDVMAAVMKAYGISVPESDEDDDPNRESGRSN